MIAALRFLPYLRYPLALHQWIALKEGSHQCSLQEPKEHGPLRSEAPEKGTQHAEASSQ